MAVRRAAASTIVFINQATDNSVNEKERMRISADGNVGIGTNNPQSALQVNGYVQLGIVSGAPPAADCDELSEQGRTKYDPSADRLYLCRGAAGWSFK